MTSKPDLGILLAGHDVHGLVAEAIGDCVVEVGTGPVAARVLITVAGFDHEVDQTLRHRRGS